VTRLLLRPTNAVWFEMLIARDDLASALGCIAAGGNVELESQSQGSVADLLPRLRAALDDQGRLAQRYASYWPDPSTSSAEPHAEPDAISAAALQRLHAWAAAADPLITELQKLQHERTELAYLERLLTQDVPLPAINLLFNAGPVLAGRIYLLETGTGRLSLPTTVLAQRIDYDEQSYLLAVGPSGQIKTLDEGLNALKARRLQLPLAVGGAGVVGGVGAVGGDDISERLEARLAEIARATHRLRAELTACDVEHQLDTALADMALVAWFADHVPEFARTDHFARVTGWTSDPSGRRVDTCLRGAGIHYLIRLGDPPPQLTPPIVLRNPRWARPFEAFARLLGTPGANEADPSALLALLAPLMFGFMFGDVGQGAVLIVAGFALRKRYAAAELLIAGGIAAIAFGALFGSVFALEGILPALWLHPLQKPLRLLEVSLAGGGVVILIGLALDALESYWRGEGLRWWATRAGLVLSYLAAIACVVAPRAAWLIPAGLGWYCAGEAVHAEHPAKRLGASIAEAIETLLQLLINTLSFVRVGAFALAHAGLAAAINALCAGIETRWLAILGLAFGNALLIVIEGLVVGIQTTRLVLFEFFIRFLRADGRALQPLRPVPITITTELSRKSS
jgi:V/A-type H+/Na+-transporting ATPase subunit I